MFYDKLKVLFPDLEWEQVVLVDDPPRILVWNRPEPQPTEAEVNAVPYATAIAAKKDRKGEEGINRLSEIDKAWIQVLAPRLGITPHALRQELKAELKK